MVYQLGQRSRSLDQPLKTFRQILTELQNCEILTTFLSVHLLSLLVLKLLFVPRCTLFAYMIFKNNEINESYKLCQVRGKHTVGGIVFYKHLFLVSYFFQIMSEYDQAFDPNILIGHCDLISRFSDFALYLDTQLVYFHTFFRL